MARTSAEMVKEVLAAGKDYDLDDNPILLPYIDAASSIVDDIVSCVSDKELTALTSAKLEIIERWLAAHFYVVSDQTYASKSTQGASASFHGKTGMHLESSRYGQTAITLDSSGCLAAIGKQARASGFWGGKTIPQQLDYRDRME